MQLDMLNVDLSFAALHFFLYNLAEFDVGWPIFIPGKHVSFMLLVKLDYLVTFLICLNNFFVIFRLWVTRGFQGWFSKSLRWRIFLFSGSSSRSRSVMFLIFIRVFTVTLLLLFFTSVAARFLSCLSLVTLVSLLNTNLRYGSSGFLDGLTCWQVRFGGNWLMDTFIVWGLLNLSFLGILGRLRQLEVGVVALAKSGLVVWLPTYGFLIVRLIVLCEFPLATEIVWVFVHYFGALNFTNY